MATIVRELEALERLHREFGFSYAQLAQALNTSEPTPVYLKRLEALEAFLEELDELFASKRAAAAWLDKALAVLKDRTPRAMILDGHVDRVTGVLYALNAGVSL